jgi:hypothetical protein
MNMAAIPEEWDEDTYFSLKDKQKRDKHKRNNSILLKELERAEDLLYDQQFRG